MRPFCTPLFAFAALTCAPLASAQIAEAPDRAVSIVQVAAACDAAIALPTLDLGDDMANVMPEVDLVGQPAPTPNLCAESAPVTVLPPGARFRLDPLPPSSSDDLGRQLLREQGLERLRQQYLFSTPPVRPDPDALRQQIEHTPFERLVPSTVAPSGQRP